MENTEQEIRTPLKKWQVNLQTLFVAVIFYVICSFISWDITISHWGWFTRLLLAFAVLFVFIVLTIIRWKTEYDYDESQNQKEETEKSNGIPKSAFQERLDELAKERGFKSREN